MSNKYMIPEGTRDLILQDCKAKKKLQKDIESILDKWGYEEIVTPTIEFYQTFNSGFQNLKEEDVYKFFDSKGRILVLRPDMTIPIARVCATKFNNTDKPIRLRYCSDVFRVHESLGGKKNEYTDCGVELIGLESSKADLEILLTALDTLKVLHNTNFNLEIGNIDFFNSAIKDLNLNEEEIFSLSNLIDRKSLKELDDFLDELKVQKEYKEFFKELPWLFGGADILVKAKKYAFNKEIKASLEYLEEISKDLEELGYKDNITFDLGMVPRLNYYSGIIFKGYADGVGTTVLSGGRYDNLNATFGKDRPAIGFSINLDSMLATIKDNSLEKVTKYLVIYDNKNKVKAIKKSMDLREEGKIAVLTEKKGTVDIIVEKVVLDI
ncbi:MAG: ATP phosphoribosyltransferase regulatory subunit [Clostridiales bacterium]|nr:ATP phosphoribosyltransferase regulatory subunit [Clostridiales bacterium]